jgi:transcriptional regulator with XRE-family HTH domain
MDFGTFVKRVGARVRRARWAEGLTQEEVAAAVLTFRLLAELERGRGNSNRSRHAAGMRA